MVAAAGVVLVAAVVIASAIGMDAGAGTKTIKRTVGTTDAFIAVGRNMIIRRGRMRLKRMMTS